jgi:AraC family transcriptional regulator
MDVTVEDLPEQRVLAITHVGPNAMIGEAFRRLAGVAGPAGLMERCVGVAIFHDDSETTPAASLRSSAGLIVADDVAVIDGLEELRIPAGKYARATHVGHYATLRDSWDKLMGQWLPNSGYRIVSRYSYEVYRVADHSRPDALETDLYVAIA